MPPPRKPMNLHILSGYAKKQPGRLRDRAGEPLITTDLRDIPPPKHLDKEHREIWREAAQQLEPWVAGESDVPAFEMLVRLIRMMRTDETDGRISRPDYIRCSANST